MVNKKNFNREQIYWICQFLGWGGFILINVLFTVFIKGEKSQNFIILPVYFILGIVLTHIYRNYIKKHRWHSLSIKKLVTNVVISNLLISLIIVAIFYGIIIIFSLSEHEFNWIYIVISIFNVFIIIIGWSLVYFSIHFFENYRNAEIERLVWEAAVKDFELKTLKSQLNPHFMFNALNSIRSLIEENPERAKTTITQLSNIFRYSLRIDKVETVPLEEELKTVIDYLDLEKVRFEERLNYEIDIDPMTRGIEIPPMMIQTLVENSIKHGISKIPDGGKIRINSRRNKECLVLEIENSGEIDLEALNNATGYGISNTKQRLNILFGGRSNFRILNTTSKNKVENFVKVEIKIPLGGNCNESTYS
ncbi:MAG: histidine kinase [Ignavibacteriales bacterium]|jgi:sensor histidine kinase YesM|nr:histidine kinase [Ignavibacteriaceae bacterium]NLH59814.1 histidine kinase [Ignavibacteriales bacterium]HOJ18353.1 histidine kinase [Ignavibacteriaceae bacterium]HPO56763.1 histidine kinase [Ignavibacteriaceae bacterium]